MGRLSLAAIEVPGAWMRPGSSAAPDVARDTRPDQNGGSLAPATKAKEFQGSHLAVNQPLAPFTTAGHWLQTASQSPLDSALRPLRSLITHPIPAVTKA